MKTYGKKKGGKFFLLAMILMTTLPLGGQVIQCNHEDRAGEPGNLPEALSGHCDDPLNYAVDQENLSHHPQLVVWVNFHYIRRDDGTGNFKEPGEALFHTELGRTELDGVAAAGHLLGHMNVRMGTFEKYNLSDALHVPESGIRFRFYSEPGNPDDPYGGIFFHESDLFFNLGYNGNDPNVLKNEFSVYGAGVLDLFFVEEETPDPDPGQPPFYIGGGRAAFGSVNSGSAVVAGMYSDHFFDTSGYSPGERDIVHYKSVTIHEIFHNLGLQHSFTCQNECRFIDLDTEAECNTPGDDCSFSGNGGAGPGQCANRYVSPTNNIMRHGLTATAITPCQLGIIQHHLLAKQPGYLEFDFCDISEPDIVIQSGQDIVWAGTRYLRSNVVVENGARLTIRCLLGMPQGSIITVEPGGTLIMDGGVIVDPCGETSQSRQGTAATPRLLLFPNPAGDILNVLLNDPAMPLRSGATFHILDAQGRLLAAYSADRMEEATLMLPVQGLPAGLCLLQYLDAQGVLWSGKFVKQ
ncbi:MAG: T9SS type A sorting domain-containing protein [Phaeodactylibacter sp.]|nr:T9SS type A sorting domain-containing protein [Phaeodactylibacter sp.]